MRVKRRGTSGVRGPWVFQKQTRWRPDQRKTCSATVAAKTPDPSIALTLCVGKRFAHTSSLCTPQLSTVHRRHMITTVEQSTNLQDCGGIASTRHQEEAAINT